MWGGEYKWKVAKMHLKVRDQQLKTIIYIQLYKNLTAITNQKSIIDTYTKKKEKSKHKNKESSNHKRR